jgi:hypothetical protein
MTRPNIYELVLIKSNYARMIAEAGASGDCLPRYVDAKPGLLVVTAMRQLIDLLNEKGPVDNESRPGLRGCAAALYRRLRKSVIERCGAWQSPLMIARRNGHACFRHRNTGR